MTRQLPPFRQLGQHFHHGLRSATNQMLRLSLQSEKLCHKAMKARTTIICSEIDFGPGGAEIVDTGKQISRPDAIIERHTLGRAPGGTAAVTPLAEKFSYIRQKWCLTNSTSDETNVVEFA